MEEDSKVNIDTKKTEATNNELSIDERLVDIRFVIPTQSEEIREREKEALDVSDYTITNGEFSVAIIKCITGASCLFIPYAILNIGIIPTIVIFLLITVVNIISTRYLMEANEGIKKRHIDVHDSMKIENDYANLMYQLYDMKGYYIFVVFFYITIWSLMLGIMVNMTDFIKQLPYSDHFLGEKSSRDLILHLLSTLLCYIACCIRNTKKLFFVSWLGIFTLVLSYLIIFIYGFSSIRVIFDPSLLWAHDIKSFFSSLSIVPYILCYNFCFLTYFKQVSPEHQSMTFKTTVHSIFSVFMGYLIFAIPSTIIYASIRDENGHFVIQPNIISNLPSNSIWTTVVYVLMWISCLCSEPILLNTTTDLLEINCPIKSNSFFVTESKRLWIRFVQIASLSFISYILPFHSSISLVNVYILCIITISYVILNYELSSFAFIATSILIPVIIHYSAFKTTMDNKQKSVHWIVGLFASIFMAITIYFSTLDLIDSIREY